MIQPKKETRKTYHIQIEMGFIAILEEQLLGMG